MKIAISGKGGVGKTTFASFLIRAFADQGKKVLAIDADPEMHHRSHLVITKDMKDVMCQDELTQVNIEL